MNWISYAFLISVAVVVPFALGSYLGLFNRLLFKPFFFGILAFTLSQVFLRIPILQFALAPQVWFITFSYAYPTLFIFLLSLSAGVFEEFARYLIMKRFLYPLNLKQVISFGLGHGGIEALLLVGVPALLNASYFISVEVVYAGIERISAMMIHVALSLMVYKALKEKSKRNLVLAITAHTLFNFLAVLALRQGLALWAVEGLLFVFAGSLLVINVKEGFNVKERVDH